MSDVRWKFFVSGFIDTDPSGAAYVLSPQDFAHHASELEKQVAQLEREVVRLRDYAEVTPDELRGKGRVTELEAENKAMRDAITRFFKECDSTLISDSAWDALEQFRGG